MKKPSKILYTAHPYGNRIYMFRDRKELEREYKRLTDLGKKIPRDCDGITLHLGFEKEADLFLIGWFDPWKISTLAHECSHAAFRLCHKVGIELDWDNNEAHAYLLGDMMDVFMGVRK